MGTKTMLTMTPERWRLLSAVEFVEGGVSYVARLLDMQGSTVDDLGWLVQAGLLQITAGGVTVAVENLTSTGRAYCEVTLTDAGRRLLMHDSAWLVLRVFDMYGHAWHNGRGHPVAVLRNVAGAGDDVLHAMEAAHLLQAQNPQTHEPVPLAAFRKIPARLRVRLLAAGQSYLPRT